MQKQLEHYEFKQIQKQNSNEIIFVLDNLEHEENIGPEVEYEKLKKILKNRIFSYYF